ncbi:hypothetical protein [Aurantimonas coralicida]|uniref:hypothetical protein n=1 Tax=Aurantimonas coralicida TaxID=182270 RepID=UPI001D195A44|nr:hypothetical protein [Aurantimonas coralicida]MCC4298080.1 hypothetical protein [Aurantimonas coralicida]
MKKRYEAELSPSDLAGLDDDAIDTSDIVELDDALLEKAVLVEPDLTRPVTARGEKKATRGP